MPDLETLLRDVAPAPDPAWAARLDARAARGFPSPPPRWKVPLIAIREHLLGLGLTATVACGLIALVIGIASYDGSDDSGAGGASSSAAAPASAESGSGGSGSGSSGASGGAEPASGDRSSTGSSAGASGGVAGDAGGGPAPSTVAPQAPTIGGGADTFSRGRAVVSSASLTLSTTPDHVNAVADRAIRVVDGLGGYVQTSEVSSSGSAAGAALTVKIPSAKLASGLAQLSRLAHVKSRSQRSDDVTDVRRTLEAAVRDARADREGLRKRLAQATTDEERSKLRAELDRASRRVTQRERRVAALGREISYATVDLEIDGDRRSGVVPPGGRWTPGDAAGDAARVLEVIAGVLLIAAAVLLPVGLIAALATYAGRLLVRRRRERALEMA